MDKYTPIITMVLGGVIGWLLHQPPTHHTESVTRRVDTVTHVITHEPTIITQAPADTVVVRNTDTIYQTPAFTARIDTVVVRDTITAEYHFPQHTFSVALRQAPDSVRIEYVTVTLTQRPAWYEWAGVALGGLATGYLMGQAR